MAFLQLQEMTWHQGELEMQNEMHVPPNDNPTVPALSAQLANHLQIAPLVAIGIIDEQQRPWTSLWGGVKGLGQPVAPGMVGLRTPVAVQHDPVVEHLFGGVAPGEVVREEGRGRMVSGVTIDLETRKRVKFFGRMIAGAVKQDDGEDAEAQLVMKIEQSLGNCPKYLNKKHIVPTKANPTLISDSVELAQEAQELIHNADLFFISSSHNDEDMDTNHRGGPAGFLRCVVDAAGTTLYWPEYSGNRLYQTLGNLKVTPRAGISIPDFTNGNMLFLTGRTTILTGADAAILPKTTLAVKFEVEASRFVKEALPFRGVAGDHSPYNPTLRYLTSEKKQPQTQAKTQQATLLKQDKITPTISRYRFRLTEPAVYRPGQYVTFDFSSLLGMGWSHMRDDDPRSLNDDLVRTFTVSSVPDSSKTFDITIRHVGIATNHMAKFLGTEVDERQRLEVDIKGFGGDFCVSQKGNETITFIAAGVGVTPLLSALPQLDLSRLRLIWTLRAADTDLARHVFEQDPGLAGSTTLFLTGSAMEQDVASLQSLGVEVIARRLEAKDVKDLATKTYLCTATSLRKLLATWMREDNELVFEDFNY